MNDAYYLRPNVQIDPLVNQWYAWSHLISPAYDQGQNESEIRASWRAYWHELYETASGAQV